MAYGREKQSYLCFRVPTRMTLNITVVTPLGAWQCSDHRLSNPDTGAIEDDLSMKHLTLHCRDGHALISYSGIGSIRGRHVSDWLRETLRGESRSLIETLTLIRANATRWIGPHVEGRYPHLFNMGVYSEGAAWLVQIGNVWKDGAFSKRPTRIFESSVRRVDQGVSGAVGGTQNAVARADLGRLEQVVAKSQDIKRTDIHGLLAAVNRRAASRDSGISLSCVTSYMPPTGEPTEHVTHKGGTFDRYRAKHKHKLTKRPSAGSYPAQRASPILLFGIDLTVTSQVLMDAMQVPVDQRSELLKKLTEETGQRSVTPKK